MKDIITNSREASKQNRDIQAQIHDEIVDCIDRIEDKYSHSLPEDIVLHLVYSALQDVCKQVKTTYPIKIQRAKEYQNIQQPIKLNESQLRNIIKESINKVLNEGMSVKEYLDSLPKGSIVNNKRVLALLKKKGLIYDYSPWGYLEWASIIEVDENGNTTWSTHSYLFPKGNAPKNGKLIVPENEQFITDQDIEFMGHTFNKKYLDGCFSAYLQKTSGNEEGAVSPRGSLWGNVY